MIWLERKGESGLLRTKPQIFLLCDTNIHINTGMIWLERKGEFGLLQTRPQIFLLCDNDINRQEDFGYKGSKGKLAFYREDHRSFCSMTLISVLIQEGSG